MQALKVNSGDAIKAVVSYPDVGSGPYFLCQRPWESTSVVDLGQGVG